MLERSYNVQQRNKMPPEYANDQSYQACSTGNLEQVTALVNNGDFNHCTKYFGIACINGHLRVADYLWNSVDSAKQALMLRGDPSSLLFGNVRDPIILVMTRSCKEEHISMFTWLLNEYSRTPEHLSFLKEIALDVWFNILEKGYLQWAKYLKDTLPNVDFLGFTRFNLNSFCIACDNGDIHFAQWLLSLYPTDQKQEVMSYAHEYSFYQTCLHRRKHGVMRWLYDQCDHDDDKQRMLRLQLKVPYHHDKGLRYVCSNGDKSTIQWYYSSYQSPVNRLLAVKKAFYYDGLPNNIAHLWCIMNEGEKLAVLDETLHYTVLIKSIKNGNCKFVCDLIRDVSGIDALRVHLLKVGFLKVVEVLIQTSSNTDVLKQYITLSYQHDKDFVRQQVSYLVDIALKHDNADALQAVMSVIDLESILIQEYLTQWCMVAKSHHKIDVLLWTVFKELLYGDIGTLTEDPSDQEGFVVIQDKLIMLIKQMIKYQCETMTTLLNKIEELIGSRYVSHWTYLCRYAAIEVINEQGGLKQQNKTLFESICVHPFNDHEKEMYSTYFFRIVTWVKREEALCERERGHWDATALWQHVKILFSHLFDISVLDSETIKEKINIEELSLRLLDLAERDRYLIHNIYMFVGTDVISASNHQSDVCNVNDDCTPAAV